MQRRHRKFHLGIFGASGNGKTEYAMRFMANGAFDYVFLFDPEEEFADAMGLPIVRTPPGIDRAIRSGWLAYDPSDMFPGETEKGLSYFCKLAMEASKILPGRKLMGIDELGSHITTNFLPRSLKIAVQRGRRSGLDCLFIAQQPNELHNTVRAQLTEVVCFQLTDDCALEWPKKFGFDIEAIRRLPPFHYICRNKRGQEIHG